MKCNAEEETYGKWEFHHTRKSFRISNTPNDFTHTHTYKLTHTHKHQVDNRFITVSNVQKSISKIDGQVSTRENPENRQKLTPVNKKINENNPHTFKNVEIIEAAGKKTKKKHLKWNFQLPNVTKH